MAVAFRSSSNTGNDANATSRAPAVPTGATTDDVVVIVLTRWTADSAITAPSGFTDVGTTYPAGAGGSSNANIHAFWKRLTGADTGTYTFSWTNNTGNSWTHAHAFCFSGCVITGSPIEAINNWAGTAGSIGSISVSTTTQPGLIFSVYNDTSGTHTPPSSFTEVADFDSGEGAYRVPGTTGTQTASGASITSSSATGAILIALKAASSSTDYVKTPSDTVGITDAATRVMAAVRAQSDAVGITDSVRVSLSKTIADNVGITDTRAYTDGENQTDPVGVTDSATRVVTAVRAPADSVGVTDTRTAGRGKAQTDAVGITDSVTGVISLTKTVTDSVGIADSRTTSRSRSSGDGVGLTDSVAATKTVARTVTDAVGVTDSVNTSGAGGVTKTDPIGITDSRTVIRSIHVTIADTVGLHDYIPTGVIRDICVSLVNGPRTRARSLTGPKLAPRVITGPRVERSVTGPAIAPLKVESLGMRVHTVTGPTNC